MLDVADREKAEAEARRANSRLQSIRDAERFNENKSLVGRTYRTRSNYSFPEKRSDYWWVYVKVQKIDKHGMLTVFSFNVDKYGATQTQIDQHRYHMSDYTEISSAQFDKAWRAFQNRIKATRP